MKFKNVIALFAVALLAADALGGVEDSLVRVRVGDKIGSGTCVLTDSGRSVIATNDHFDNVGPAPATVTVGGKTVYGTILPGDREADVALVVVAADIPAVEVRRTPVKVGEAVWHKGGGSGGGTGKVTVAADARTFTAFRTTARSVSGDSGAGIFDAENRLVAVHRGRYDPEGENTQCGGKAAVVLSLVEKIGVVQVVEQETTAGKRLIARPKNVPVAAPHAAPVQQYLPPQLQQANTLPACANGRCWR